VLQADPRHFDALICLGDLAVELGHRRAARTALEQAVRVRPQSPIGHTNLATLLREDGETSEAREHYQAALRLDPVSSGAHQGLAILLLRLGELEAARIHGRLGVLGQAQASPYRGDKRPVPLLLLLSALGNAPLEPFIDDRIFLKWTVFVEFLDPAAELPPHDLVLNAIGDADRCASGLELAERILARTTAPVLNLPSRVRATGRAANAERLGQLSGVVSARTAEWTRESLLASDAPSALERGGFAWPLLLRSPGYHTGKHFVKVDGPADLPSAIEALPGARLLVMQFVDTRSADGQFRKYRVMVVDGVLYPFHLAVSSNWKVHYLTADMADHPEYRAEDDAFLKDMSQVLGQDVLRTLDRIRDQLGLDYGGVDFGFDARGNLVVFEANATMAMLAPQGDDRWDYRRTPVNRVREATRRMLVARAGRR